MSAPEIDPLESLQQWYLARADGSWEHSHGITIETLDNPGWSLKVQLAETPLAELHDANAALERSEHDWVDWRIDGHEFVGACGPLNLGELIQAFLAFTRRNPRDADGA